MKRINKKFYKASFVIILVISSSAVSSASLMRDFNRAVDMYRSGNYPGAYTGFITLYSSGLVNGKLLYNAGNSAFRMGNVGMAILHYRQAMFFMPGNPDLKWNLKMARSRTVDRIEEKTSSKIISMMLSVFRLPVKITVLGFLLLHVITWLLLGFYVVKRKKMRKSLVIIPAVVYCFFMLSLLRLGYDLMVKKDGVVVVPATRVYSGTDTKSAVLFEIHEGTEVSVIKTHDGWASIVLADGKRGWIKKNSVEIVQDAILNPGTAKKYLRFTSLSR